MSDQQRSIELEVEVVGTVEEVWRAIATGPGISSWYVPHDVEEREGGSALASFGPGPEMQVAGRVAAWDPPRRVVFDGGADDGGMAFEWLVEARAGGTCVVRLVNSGFGAGDEWDDQYDAMESGWRIFLANLRLHLEYFGGRTGTPMLPMATWNGSRSDAWTRLTGDLGLDPSPSVGDRVEAIIEGGPSLGGAVADAAPSRMAVLLDHPAPGTLFLAVEGNGEQVQVSIWLYLYGDDSRAIAARELPRWQAWLDERSVVT